MTTNTVWPNGTTKSKPRVSSKYGRRSGGAFSFHYGTDFIGYSDLRAILAGKVTLAGTLNGAAGISISIDANERGPKGETITIVRMHAARVATYRGASVKVAQSIGTMGSTGNASGNCDHVEIRYWLNGGYKTVDPEQWIAARIAAEAAGAPAASKPNAQKWPARSMYGAKHVEQIQILANRLGAKLKTDGYDGPATQAWVKAFQKANGMNPDGIAGPLTESKMRAKIKRAATVKRPTLKIGSRGSQVKAVQNRLRANYPAYARTLKGDGIFGTATAKVVAEFQRRAGLKADGIVGPKTWARLGF